MCDAIIDTKTELECRKLELEIAALDAPQSQSPALWISIVTTFVAVCAFAVQVVYSSREIDLAKRELAIQQEKAEVDSKALKLETASAEAKLEVYQNKLVEVLKLLRKSPNSVTADLQKEILDVLPLEIKKQFFDPTGNFPFHVPPEN